MWVAGRSGVVEPFLCPQALVGNSARLWVRLGAPSFPTSNPPAQGRLSTAGPQAIHMAPVTPPGLADLCHGALHWDQQVHRATAH
nr:MAG TPA: hypothetical protein [Caudoviricetes sp.]